MTLFDLLFIAVFLASVITLLTVGVMALVGSRAKAVRILRAYAFCIAVYFAIVIVVSIVSPRQILEVGEDKCFDDWCIGVESFTRAPSGSNVIYQVTLRLSSRARRVSQREKGVVAYLRDSRGRRFDPVPAVSEVPISTQLLAQQSVTAERAFALPSDAQDVGLVIAHEGGFPITWFIIGGGPFHKDPMVRLP